MIEHLNDRLLNDPHLSDEHILAYLGRRLAAKELLSASDHLAECDGCRARVSPPKTLHDGLAGIRAVLNAEAKPSHLTYDEITSYVDGRVNVEDGARVELHAWECPPCARDLKGIQAVRKELEAPPAKRQPWGSFADFWRTGLNWKGSLALAGVAGCALLVFVVRGPGPEGAHRRAQAEAPQAGVSAGGAAGVSAGVAAVGGATGVPAGVAAAGGAKGVPTDVVAAGVPAGDTASIRDGNRLVSIGAGGKLSGLDALAGSDRTALEQVLAAKRIDAPAAIAGLAGAGGVLMGSHTEASRTLLVAPVGRVVETDQPVLRWKPVPGAEFLVSVFDSRYDEMASSGWIRDAEWRVPRALGRGAVYSWQINVRQNGAEFTVPAPPAPEARFRILSAAAEAELIRVRGAAGDSHLALGLQYARAGMLEEAGQELRTLREQNPGSETVAALLESVERIRLAPPGARPRRQER